MKLVQIIPLKQSRLYGAIVKKQAEISRQRPGAFSRAGTKTANKAKWKHVRFKGWINLKRERTEIVTAKVNSADWQLLSAFVGWIDRHFGDQVQSVTIHYR
jgi:hypothetical protein